MHISEGRLLIQDYDQSEHQTKKKRNWGWEPTDVNFDEDIVAGMVSAYIHDFEDSI
jgi:hypothetical protein